MNCYYVYYKVTPEQLPALRPAVKALLDSIEKQCGVRGRWLRRRDDVATYMEVYDDVKDVARFEAALEREGARLGVPRKVERFISAETPA
jgi:hypothetical protein